MSQEEIIRVIKKYPNGITANNIQKEVGLSGASVRISLVKLVKYKEIYRIQKEIIFQNKRKISVFHYYFIEMKGGKRK